MKVFLSISFISILFVSACSSDNGPSCDEVCAKIQECNPDDAGDCLDQCASVKNIMRESVYNSMGNCYLDMSCDALNADDNVCMVNAMSEIPDGVVDGFIGDLCDKMISCAATGTKDECVSKMKEEGGDSIQMAGMFKDSILDCTSECFAAKDCSALDGAMEDCMKQCGMNFKVPDD